MFLQNASIGLKQIKDERVLILYNVSFLLNFFILINFLLMKYILFLQILVNVNFRKNEKKNSLSVFTEISSSRSSGRLHRKLQYHFSVSFFLAPITSFDTNSREFPHYNLSSCNNQVKLLYARTLVIKYVFHWYDSGWFTHTVCLYWV